MILRSVYRKRAYLPFRGGTPSVPVGVDGLPLEAVVADCHGEDHECSPYGDGTVYGDGELYCAADEGRGFYLSLCEIKPHILSVRIEHANGTRLIIDTVKPHLKPDPNPLPYQHQTEVDSNCPQHLSLRVFDRSGQQLVIRRLLPFVNVRRNRPVA